jgi:GT2 family glycosyltransferase
MDESAPIDDPTTPPVWMVIVTWNRVDAVISCLISLNALTYPNFRVVVVDNGSTDGTVRRLRAIFPSLDIIANSRNQGYTGGNNAGIEHALKHGAAYVLMINNDTRVHPHLIDELVAVAESDPRIAVVGAKALWEHQPRRVWAAWCELTYGPTLTRIYGRNAIDSAYYRQVRDVGQVVGCGYLWRREALADVGLLDTSFFGYHEDVDWCYRARKNGWRVVYAGEAIVYHKGSLSCGPQFRERMPMMYFLGRNAVLFTKKHANLWRLAQITVASAVGSLQRAWRGWSTLTARSEVIFWQGFLDGLANRNRQTNFRYEPSAAERSQA